MADPVQPIQPVAPAPVEPAASLAPAIAAPAPSPPLEPAAALAPAPAPVVEPAPAAPVAPVEAKPVLASDKPSLLEEFDRKAAEEAKAKETAAKPAEPAKPAEAKPEDKKPEVKPADPAKPADAKPAEAKPAEAPKAPDPVAYTYELPPTITMDEPRKAEFHTALDGFRADPVKGAQGLIQLHEKAMSDYAAQVARDQQDAFNKTRSGWVKDAMADAEIGGAGHQTSMKAIARMRDLLVPAADRPAFDQFLRITGAGDHPQFLKLLHRAAAYYDEPAPPNPDIKPPKDIGVQPGGKRGRLYDHPSSNRGKTAS